MLKFVAKDDNLCVNSNCLLKVILNKDVNLNVLYYYILKRVTYVIC
jgi:hypothetical protein